MVKTLDYIKADVQRQLEEVGCHEIPCRDWAIHSTNRATPYNMPIQDLSTKDEPLRFSWHERSPSYETQHMWMGQVYQRIARSDITMPMTTSLRRPGVRLYGPGVRLYPLRLAHGGTSAQIRLFLGQLEAQQPHDQSSGRTKSGPSWFEPGSQAGSN